MFGSNKKPSQKTVPTSTTTTTPTASSNSINSLGAGTVVDGNISTSSDIRIDGELKGNLTCQGKLIIGPSGKIDGNADCKSAIVEGTLIGTFTVTDVLEVRSSSHIEGDVKTGQLVVEPGAKFNVSCAMGNTSSTVKPSASKAKKEVALEYS